MAKDKSLFVCSECGGTSPKWLGKCPSCGAWNTLVEQVAGAGSGPANNRFGTQFASLAGASKLATLSEIEATDVGMAVILLCTVTDIAGESAPDLWRRYLPMMLDGLRGGSALPVPAISAEDFRAAMSCHKQRLIRAVDSAPRYD